uniref:Uncharacterized protein n=1 Tax=Pundamilia nyererei TaxID=303518 RepID=A0A3B4GG96_9CICH
FAYIRCSGGGQSEPLKMSKKQAPNCKVIVVRTHSDISLEGGGTPRNKSELVGLKQSSSQPRWPCIEWEGTDIHYQGVVVQLRPCSWCQRGIHLIRADSMTGSLVGV